jgi:hypothetical protein
MDLVKLIFQKYKSIVLEKRLKLLLLPDQMMWKPEFLTGTAAMFKLKSIRLR